MKSLLQDRGFALWPCSVRDDARAILRDTILMAGEAGARCLLDLPPVRAAAQSVGWELIECGILKPGSVAVQAIAFDKSPDANWKVTWHQDLMFPFEGPVHADGYELASVKDGVDYARPPRGVLEALLAVRLHLDDCDCENGPLRVCPGTHRFGIIPSVEIAGYVERGGEVVCTAKEGEVLLMHPLLLHASSKALVPRHRRVLHLVFYSGSPALKSWHRAIAPNQALEPTAPTVTHPADTGCAPVGAVAHLGR